MVEVSQKKIKEYKDYLKENLSKKRYEHSLNVAHEAKKLAGEFDADKEKCYLAGLLHDVSKEIDNKRHLELLEKSDLWVSEIEKNAPPLYHAISGAVTVKELFGIDDEEIILAIRYHTVARKGMSKIEEIIYLADLVSEDRDYKDVKKMRKLAHTDIDKAMLEALRFSIKDSVEKGNTIPVSTLEAYNFYADKFKTKGMK